MKHFSTLLLVASLAVLAPTAAQQPATLAAPQQITSATTPTVPSQQTASPIVPSAPQAAVTALPATTARVAKQPAIKLLADDIHIDALVSTDHSTRDIKVKVSVDLSDDALKGEAVPLTFKLGSTGTMPDAMLLTETVTAPKEHKGKFQAELTLRLTSIEKDPPNEYTLPLTLNMDTAKYEISGVVILRITSPHNYIANKPFWIEVGANFDLAEQKLEPNNVFGGIFLYKRELKPLQRRADKNPYAVAAGVYESKAVAQEYAGAYIAPYYSSGSFNSHPDSFLLFNDTGAVTATRQARNIGLFFTPQFRFTSGSSDKNGLHLFASAYFEILWQNIEINYDYSATARRNIETRPMVDLSKYGLRQDKRSFNIYSHYEGVGMPIYFKENYVNLYINPVFGITNQPTDGKVIDFLNGAGNRSLLSKEWSAFYLVQFRLSEDRYGLSLSGEVRQLLHSESKPLITMVLSKKFDISKLIEYNINRSQEGPQDE